MKAMLMDFMITGAYAVVAVAIVNQTPLRPFVTGEKRLIGTV